MKINSTIPQLLLGLTLSTWLAACGSSPTEVRDKAVKEQLEAKLKAAMNDPESYEFASLTLVDSNLYSDNAAALRGNWQQFRDIYQGTISREQRYQADPLLNSLFDAENLRKAENNLASNNAVVAAIDSLALAMGADTNHVASYTYEFAFRGKNAMGAKVLSQKFVQTGVGPKFEIITVEDKREIYETRRVGCRDLTPW